MRLPAALREGSRRLGGWLAGRAWLLSAVGGTLATAFCFYPGFINSDSQWQLDQAISGRFDDWHPPLLAWLWAPLNRLIPGPGGLFLLHAALFWTGLAAVAAEAFPSRVRGAVVAATLGLFPPMFIALATVGKDAAATAALVSAFGLLLRAHSRRSRPAWLASVPCLIYALGVRHNAFAAVVPLAVWAGWMAPDVFRLRPRRWRLSERVLRIASVIALSALLPAVVILVEARIIKPKRSHVSQAVMIHDLVGISLWSDENLIPLFYARDHNPLTLDELDRAYSPADCTGLLWAPSGSRVPGFVWSEDELRQLRAAWLAAIRRHPASYAQHRASYFSFVLGLRAGAPWPYWLPAVVENDPSASPSAALRARLIGGVARHRQSALFRGWPYCGGILIALGVAIARRRLRIPLVVVAMSALGYEAAYFVVGTASDFRFSWWPMAASLVCACLLAAPRQPTIHAASNP